MTKTNFFVTLGAAVLSGVLLLGMALDRAVPTGSWGLSFQTPSQPPAAPMSPERLRELDGAYWDVDGGKVLYLTFDAGYENGYTDEILDILQKQQVPAAFFVTGDYLKRSADLVRRMTREGHIVGNHTLHHPDMTALSAEEFAAELQGAEELYFDITEQTMPKFYRPPQGVYDERSLERAKEKGYRTVFWSLAYADWDNDHQPDPEAAVEKLNSRIHDGAVILLHATSKTNAEILDRLLTGWKEMGYRFAPLTELFS